MLLAKLAIAMSVAQFSFISPPDDPASAPLQREAAVSRRVIEKFLHRRFRRPVRLEVVATRKDFDAEIPPDWGMTPSQCWMVGVGVYDRLILLSPTAWKSDACDHKPGNIAEAKSILRHELTHVLHGQYNPTRDFTGMDDAAWFVEGLATYVSGQLDEDRLAAAVRAVSNGEGPQKVGEAWTGQNRYGFAGSMVAFIDHQYGRARLVSLLDKTNTANLMRSLGTDEVHFLAAWSAWLKSRRTRHHT